MLKSSGSKVIKRVCSSIMNSDDQHKSYSQAGFSLIELLIASFVLLIGVVSVATLIGAAVARNHSSKNDSIAMSLAEQQMEILKVVPFNILAVGGSTLQADGRLLFENPSTGSPYPTVNGYFRDISLPNSDEAGQTVNYQVRWNIAWADASNTLLRITIGARRQPNNLRLPPVQLAYIKAR
jgi:prepilin-type N-terminal cleavage/methylation domain-containing protein